MVEGRARGDVAEIVDKAKGNLIAPVVSKIESILRAHDTLIGFGNKHRKIKLIFRSILKLKK